MSGSSCCQWNKEYTVVNQNGEFESRFLNPFQRFILRRLGFYAETRLENVCNAIQSRIFQPQNSSSSSVEWTAARREKALELLNKANKYDKLNYISLGIVKSNGSDTYLQYEASAMDSEIALFKVKLMQKNSKNEPTLIREATINFETLKNRDKNKFTRLGISYLCERNYPQDNDFLTKVDDPLAKPTYLFISKVLAGSQRVEGLDMLQTHRVGGHKLAHAYGFVGEANIHQADNCNGEMISSANGFKLEKAKAQTFAHQCELTSEVTLDFFLPVKGS